MVAPNIASTSLLSGRSCLLAQVNTKVLRSGLKCRKYFLFELRSKLNQACFLNYKELSDSHPWTHKVSKLVSQILWRDNQVRLKVCASACICVHIQGKAYCWARKAYFIAYDPYNLFLSVFSVNSFAILKISNPSMNFSPFHVIPHQGKSLSCNSKYISNIKIQILNKFLLIILGFSRKLVSIFQE